MNFTKRSIRPYWAILPIVSGLLFTPVTGYAFDFWGLFGSQDETSEGVKETPKIAVDQPHPVVDPAYGDALFDFHQQRYFSAITKLLVAKEQNTLTENKEHAELLLGSLYVAYGMLDVGEAIFMAYLQDHATKAGADEAWYQLANIHYRRNNPAKALQILTTRMQQPLAEQTAKQILLQISCHLLLGQVDDAQSLSQYLDTAKSKDTLVQFNLGATYGLLGDQEKANRYYRSALYSEAQSPMVLSLKDQAAVSLGIQQYHAGEYQQAQYTLQRVRLHGPSSDMALLTMGWAMFKNDQKMDALTPWMELANRPLSSPAVQEAILNVPYTLENLGALQDALDGYKEAYKIYRQQRRNLDSIKQKINEPNWIETISPVKNALENPLEAIPRFELPVEDEATQHLYEYFASNEFQNAYRNYRELQRLYLSLHYWKQQIPSFNAMVNTHLNRLNQLAPAAAVRTQEARQLQVEAQKQAADYKSQLQTIIAEDDLVGLANPTQRLQYDRIQTIENVLKQANDRSAYRQEWEKLELLKGILLWDLNSAATAKRWEASKDITAIEALLQELESSVIRVMNARSLQINRFHRFNQRTVDLGDRIEALQQQTQTLLVAQRKHMQTLATGIIEQQQKNLNTFRAKSLLSIARLQDLAYTQERLRQKQKEKSIIFELGEDVADPQEASSTDDSPTKPEAKQPEKPAQNLFDVIQQIFDGD